MKNVLLTGATRGLGLGIARELSKEGYFVIATGRKPTPEIEKVCSAKKGKFFACDLADTKGIHDFVKKVTDECGPLYGLINNAGLGHDGVLATQHESQISELLRVNLEAPVLLSKYASRSMLLNGSGRIIQVSSVIANTGFSGLAVYGATKAGLIGFTKSLARELGKANITVNAVAPGYMETEMTESLKGEKLESIIRRSPMRKLVDVTDVGRTVVFLLSDDAGMITGTTITVDAGSTA